MNMTTLGEMMLSELERTAIMDEARAAAAMDEDTFRAFYDRTARPVWAYLSRVTGDRQLADDLLQEAYYRFYRAGAAYENESHRRNSLYRIATNLVHDHNRWNRRRADLLHAETEEQREVAGDPGTSDRIVERTDLARALEGLRPQQREALWLAYAEGSSHEEIAAVIGVGRGDVKSLLYRARKKLAKLLGGNHA